MSRGRRIAIVLGVGLMLLAIGVGPFSLMLLENPEPLPIAEIPAEGRGTYVDSGSGLYKLFPRASLAPEFPADAIVVAPKVAVYVKARQFVALEAYRLYPFGSESTSLDAAKDMLPGRLLRLRPKTALAPGAYVVEVERDDMWGGTDYFYLNVK